METEYHGGPVAGGTYPAEIWHDFMTDWIDIREKREAAAGKNEDEEPAPVTPSAPQQNVPPAEQAAPEAGGEDARGELVAGAPDPPRASRAPAPAPAPSPTPAPGGGGGGGGGGSPSGGGVGAPSD